MNAFRLLGDLSHLTAVLLLIASVLYNKSCRGISAKAQVLNALIVTTRYIDVFTAYISLYNTVMKCAFIVCAYTILALIAYYRQTYQYKKDSFWIEALVLPLIALACFVNYAGTAEEIAWTFSIYLEAWFILPQLYYIHKLGTIEGTVRTYIILLATYRSFYVLNWVYRYYTENHYDLISICSGSIQCIIYFIYFCTPKSFLMENEDGKNWKTRNMGLISEASFLVNPFTLKNKTDTTNVFIIESDLPPESIDTTKHKLIEEGKY